jgi:hypothetical protein
LKKNLISVIFDKKIIKKIMFKKKNKESEFKIQDEVLKLNEKITIIGTYEIATVKV